ncbi:hypothetical protein E4U30_002774 [Claviceps sp. LM220 group G6]|nr:hypothetical protein E4U15_006825 [Claviceps sp. LM218 group G6]KAG6095080.1 hypothetical protein E4U30_002774 [Claviceps sp. LM220 group G6]
MGLSLRETFRKGNLHDKCKARRTNNECESATEKLQVQLQTATARDRPEAGSLDGRMADPSVYPQHHKFHNIDD